MGFPWDGENKAITRLSSLFKRKRPPWKSALLGVGAAALAFVLAAAVVIANNPGILEELTQSRESRAGTWYAYTDYGEEVAFSANPEGDAELVGHSGTWDIEGGAFYYYGSDGTATAFTDNGDHLSAAVTVDVPDEVLESHKDRFGGKTTESEELNFYSSEQTARVDYEARLSSWRQELEEYEDSITQALVGGWCYDKDDWKEALVYYDNGRFRAASGSSVVVDQWSKETSYKVYKRRGTWEIKESGIEDTNLKFFKSHLSIKIKFTDDPDNGDNLYDRVKLTDEDDPTSIAIGETKKIAKAWEKKTNDTDATAAELVKSLAGDASSDEGADPEHKKTLCIYSIPSASGNATGGKYAMTSEDKSFTTYDFDADGSPDTMACRMELESYGDSKGQTLIKETVISVNGAEYAVTEEDNSNVRYCLVGLLTMDNGANFIYVNRSGSSDDGAAVLLQYRDGEIEPVASNEWLGDGVKHPYIDSVTTSGDKVDVTVLAQPLSTGQMYFTYELRYAGGRLSKMGSTTDALEYNSSDHTDSDGLVRGSYEMEANKNVACYAGASKASGSAFTVGKGEKATFVQAKTAGSTLWFKIERESDGAQGWFPNASEYEEPLPFNGFVQSG